ncbi:MAG: GH36-type glycosyl hydrolase domain-containing protein [Christensenellales bacterium]|jgi:cyclic beta-1,2-glucan synthetase
MAFIIPLLILIIAVIIRILPKKHHDIVVDMSYEEMIGNVRNIAKSLRSPQRFGAGVSVYSSARRLERAYDEISGKVKKGAELYEFERQLYENFHLIRKLLIHSLYKGYTALPHKNLNPRIITVAHFIVKGCNRKLSKERVISVVKAFNKYTPLNYNEISMLKNSLLYLLVKDIADIAAKSTHYTKMKRIAERSSVIDVNHYLKDSYLYYFKDKWGDPKDNPIIKKSDINTDNIDNAFISALIDNCIAASSIIESIRNIDKIVDDEAFLEMSASHQTMLGNDSYKQMDIDSIRAYLNAVGRLSDRFNVSEKAVIDGAFKLEKLTGTHFGEFLFGNTRRLKLYIKYGADRAKSSFNNTSGLYIATVLFFSVLSGTLFALISGIPLILRIIIAFLIALSLIKPFEHLYSYAVKYEHRFMPRMGYKVIPPEGETIVVISELLMNKESVKKAFHHLKIISSNCVDDNVTYMLLCDLLEANAETIPEDEEIINVIKEEYDKTDKMRCNILLRKRTQSDEKFTGKERKRGAIMELTRYIIEGKSDEFIYQGKELKKPEFMILLDSDNELLPGAVNRAVNSMLHPLNGKYDLLTFGCATNMHSIKTLYSLKYLNRSGIPDYGKSTDYIYDLSMSSIFCGKGIVRIKSFYEKLKDAFPENRILSHDIIEGAILNTGAIGDRVYEDAPLNIVSDIERKSRWTRGDYQLMPYIFKTKPVSIRPIYRYTIFSNVINALLPFIQLALFIAALSYMSRLVFFFLGVSLFLTYILDIIGALKGITNSVRIRYVLKNLFTITKEFVIKLALLPFDAINNLILFAITLYRMLISGKNLLAWKTYSSTQGKTRFNKYAALITPSFIVMTIISVIMDNLAFTIYTGVFFIEALMIYLTGGEFIIRDKLTDDRRATLMYYAEDMYRYFDNFIKADNNYLVPDNYQVYPYKGARQTTSPSNIGLSILAIISAFELELVTIKDAMNKFTQIITTVELMPKWHGHLYNWYNTRTLEVLYPSFVSSVDSANLIACLMALRQFLIHHQNTQLCNRVNTLITETDLAALYDKDINLFYIGYKESNGEYVGHYDLMASESRILSYIASAEFKDIHHWMKLSRECVALRGNTLVSWSGTAFEYLMPELFLETPRFSLVGHTVQNVVKEQIKSKLKGLWGISEGGFYRFDETLNYEYKAFGLRELSLRSDYSRAVVMPYASFLALEYRPAAVMKNLSNIKNHSMYGEYGFYEALDMYSGEKPVTQYMAHHLGMSISAIANYLKDGVLRKYFNSDYDMSSTRLLLTESIVKTRFKYVKDDSFIYEDKHIEESVKISPLKTLPQHNVLTNGAYSVLTDDYGLGYSNYGDILLNRYRKEFDSGFFAYIQDKKTKKVFSASYAPLRDDIANYLVRYSSNSSYYLNKADNFSMEIFVPPCFSGEVRKFNYYNKSSEGKDLRIALYTELNINSSDRDLAHPVFNDMFIRTFSMPERNAVIAKRTNLDGSGSLYAAMVVKGLNDFRIDTDRMSFVGRGRSASRLRVLTNEYKYYGEATGDVLYPCFGIYVDKPVKPDETLEFYTALIISDNYEKLVEEINEANSVDFLKHAEMASKVTSVNFYSKCIRKHFNELRMLADYLINVKFGKDALKKLSDKKVRETLMRLGIEPYTKFIVLDYKGEASDSLLTLYSGIVRYLSKAGVKAKLVIIYNDGDIYHQSSLKHIEEIIWKSRGEAHITLINRADTDSDKIKLVFETAFVYAGKIKFENSKNCSGGRQIMLDAAPALVKPVYATGEGGFDEDGNYIINPLNSRDTLLPYCNVIAAKYGGTIISSSGGGYSFGINSREHKLTVWNNDPVEDRGSEFVYLTTARGQIRLNSTASGMRAIHSRGITSFLGKVNDISVNHTQYIIKEGRAKVFETDITAQNGINCTLAFYINAALGWKKESDYEVYDIDGDVLTVTNTKTNQSLGIRVFQGGKFIEDRAQIMPRDIMNGNIYINSECAPVNEKVAAAFYSVNSSGNYVFMLSDDLEFLKSYDINALKADKKAQLDYFNGLNTVKIDSSDKSLDYLFNDWLMYQIVSSRINGRCGYYQAGGAIGFRDQLQDVMALLHSDPEFVREHILKAAAHQYEEGDVMHWWHFDRYGVRTRIRDDAVFLAYAVCEYIEATGDEDILNTKVPYVKSKPLALNERHRLEVPDITPYSDLIINHLIKAFDYAVKFGEHDLLLIGGGDWNDALDNVGLNDKGESVWLTQFAYMVIKKFMNYLDKDMRLKMLGVADRMKSALNSCGYDGKWFKRIYTDRGEWLGSKSSDVMKIDLLCQAFSVLSESADEEKSQSAMQSAMTLVDYENGLIKLLDPPFDDKNWYGYISAYPKGVRENGGQYTHAAIWFIKALIKSGKTEEAYSLLKMINPVAKCVKAENVTKYMGEPYIIPADICSHTHKGRMGWNYYTGSAAWCYRLILEDICGIKLINNCLVINPNLPKSITHMNIDYRYKNSLYKIMLMEDKANSMTVDGVEVINGNKIPLSDSGKTIEVIIKFTGNNQ